MARDKGSRRLLKFWFVLAFTFGAVTGALALKYLHAQGTLWIVLFFGAVAGAVAIFEQFGEPLGRKLRTPVSPSRWGRRVQPFEPVKPRKPAAHKHPARRAQLHAITGKKNAEPPSSGTP
jgi:uncharacterized membrane protein YfcA